MFCGVIWADLAHVARSTLLNSSSLLLSFFFLFLSRTFLSVATALGSIAVAYVIFDQLSTLRKRGNLPGPRGYIPFIGGLVEMVLDPTSFWQRQDAYGPVSWNYLAGRLMVHTTDPELSRKVLNSDSPDQLKMKVHPNAEAILGSNNIAFMQGDPHKQLRVQLLPLFTRRALAHYVEIQDRVTREKLNKWLSLSGEQEFRSLARELNTETSQIVFVGPYMIPEEMALFCEDYQRMNEGFLSFPLNLPGTALNKAVKARVKIVERLTVIVKKSKERMSKEGELPGCLLDYWMEKMVKMIAEAEANGTPLPEHHDDYEIACTVLDFLFASQDASTSSLVWILSHMAEHPEILERVREEQLQIRPQDEPVTHDQLLQMTFTRQVIKETLRIIPPASLVPQESQEDYQLTPEITIPKGTLITPSLWASSYYGYPEPHKYDPDRFSAERGEDTKYSKSFLVFGAGAHACIGKEYAINHLMTFLSIMSLNADWARRKTKESDKIVFGPTLYPGDCLLTFKQKVCV